ncbi:hypothetical protein [Streptomyces sp. bgisy095]|uniref:hypothetical protein n=1 Tax=unclassified Streptomyces TaxID=2593676 RepID=UPI003D72692D
MPHHGHEEFQHWWGSFALAGLGRVEEVIAVVEAHPDLWTDPRIVRTGLLSAAGLLTEAATELREHGTIKAREDLFEVLVLQERAAEAITVHPIVAEQCAVKAKTESTPQREDDYSDEPPF